MAPWAYFSVPFAWNAIFYPFTLRLCLPLMVTYVEACFWDAEERWIMFSDAICFCVFIRELTPSILRVVNEQFLLIPVIWFLVVVFPFLNDWLGLFIPCISLAVVNSSEWKFPPTSFSKARLMQRNCLNLVLILNFIFSVDHDWYFLCTVFWTDICGLSESVGPLLRLFWLLESPWRNQVLF